jgi:hypothetical protein
VRQSVEKLVRTVLELAAGDKAIMAIGDTTAVCHSEQRDLLQELLVGLHMDLHVLDVNSSVARQLHQSVRLGDQPLEARVQLC